MLREFRADLHIHTCLSPCGDLAMSPRRIIEEAQRKGLDMIGICDHNSAENAEAVVRAAGGSGVTVIPGIEVTTEEEVHILGLFGSNGSALEVQERVYAHLDGENDPETFGMQPVVDENGEIQEFNPRLLIGAARLSVDVAVQAIHDADGIAIASHVDRKMYSIIAQLGFVPLGLPLDGLEITGNTEYAEARRRFDRHGRYEIVQGSDAHAPDQIGTFPFVFTGENATLEELRLAFQGREGRQILRTIEGQDAPRKKQGA